MKKSRMLLAFIMSTNLLAACAAPVSPAVALAKRVVNKQCEPASVTVTSLEQELKSAGVVATTSRCASDGRMFAAVCGGPTGYVRVVDVVSGDVEKAKALGYRPVSEFPTLTTIECPAN